MALCPPTDIMTDSWILFATPHTDGAGTHGWRLAFGPADLGHPR